ncbi:MAG: hypothetical protein M3268_01055 [Acidobacteriota bacterium]|nr:hypothetical protein [Acidobacteriota bacterium]
MDEAGHTIESTGFLRELFLTDEDALRCFGSLSKLARHINGPVVLTGSIAVGWHLLRGGRPPRKRSLNDIDTVAVNGMSSTRPSLVRDFLINHFHPERERGKVLLQLVDEEHGTRTEIFTPGSESLNERLVDCDVGGLSCRAVSAEDALAKLLSITHSAIEGRPVDPKYVEQFDQLSAVADVAAAGKVWQDYRKENQRADLEEAAQAVKTKLATDPALLRATEYCQDVDFVCAWCKESESFPIANRGRVYEVLGYV